MLSSSKLLTMRTPLGQWKRQLVQPSKSTPTRSHASTGHRASLTTQEACPRRHAKKTRPIGVSSPPKSLLAPRTQRLSASPKCIRPIVTPIRTGMTQRPVWTLEARMSNPEYGTLASAMSSTLAPSRATLLMTLYLAWSLSRPGCAACLKARYHKSYICSLTKATAVGHLHADVKGTIKNRSVCDAS